MTEEEIAQDFIKFFKNWEKTFGIKNYKIYITGESYAGRYVPYISAAMLDEKDKEYYDLSGKSLSETHDILLLTSHAFLRSSSLRSCYRPIRLHARRGHSRTFRSGESSPPQIQRLFHRPT